MSFKNTNMVSD